MLMGSALEPIPKKIPIAKIGLRRWRAIGTEVNIYQMINRIPEETCGIDGVVLNLGDLDPVQRGFREALL